MIEQYILIPLLAVLIKLADMLVSKVGCEVAGQLLCKIGSHNWEIVEGEPFLRLCVRCGIVDDMRTSGIDALSESKKRKTARKLKKAVSRDEAKNK